MARDIKIKFEIHHLMYHVTYTTQSVRYKIQLTSYHHIIQDSDMYLLLFIEISVGDFGLWPFDVPSALFLDLTTDQTVRELSPFFYGNGVPLWIAEKHSALCNPFWNLRESTDMKVHYHLWHAEVDSPHHTKYYSTRYRKMYWIHDGNCARDEPVIPNEEISIEELGWGGTSDGSRILDRLIDLIHEECTFDLIP